MFDWYLWVGLPLLVFFARVSDVTLGTLRIIFTARGKKQLAPILGFVEVFIWISAISQITKGAHNIVAYLAYACGFAVGTYVGLRIEEKLAMGTFVVRAILPERVKNLTETLHEKGYGYTRVSAVGSQGAVNLIYIVVSRKSLPEVASIVQNAHPKAFFTVEELRSVEYGVFPRPITASIQDTFFGRKSK